MEETRFAIVGLLRADDPRDPWRRVAFGIDHNFQRALNIADAWLDRCQGDAVVAVVELGPDATNVDWRATGFVPLDLKEQIWQAADDIREMAAKTVGGSKPSPLTPSPCHPLNLKGAKA